MGYRIDPEVLHGVAKRAAGLSTDTDEVVRTAIELLADEYPHLIDATPGRWSAAGPAASSARSGSCTSVLASMS